MLDYFRKRLQYGSCHHMEPQMPSINQLEKVEKIPDDLRNFDQLPRSANVCIDVVAGLFSKHRGSIYRDLAAGTIPKPINLGTRATRWNVGDLRDYIEAARITPRAPWRMPTKTAEVEGGAL
jgi:predicted DNA-binding transcriptional regulator AlpA